MNKELVNRDIGIDLIRSICMLYIVGYWHLFNYTNPFSIYNNIITQIITRTALATLVLFSGFFAAKGLTNNSLSVKMFYLKKVIRIYPLYIVSLLVFLFLKIISPKVALLSLFSLSMFIKPAPATLWFITMILIFYLVTPILCKITTNCGLRKTIIIILSIVLFLLIYDYFTSMLDIRIVMYIPAYVFGVYLSKHKIIIKYNYQSIILAFIIISPLALPYYTNTNPHIASVCKIPIITLFSLMIFNWAKKYKPKTHEKLITKISYTTWCMYLFHRPIYLILTKIYFPDVLLLQVTYLLIIGLPIIMISSYIIQRINDIAITLTSKFFNETRKQLKWN